jgi:hypothetical protein
MSGQDAHQRPAGEAISLDSTQQYAVVGTKLFPEAGQFGLEGRRATSADILDSE